MESEPFDKRNGLATDDGPCRRYSLRQLAELVDVPPRRISSWVRAGLIQSVKAEDQAEAFSFHEVRTAGLLVKLSKNGVGTARLKSILNQLRRRYPDAREALSQLDLIAGLLVIRDEDSRLTAPNGQFLMELANESESVSTIALKLSGSDADDAFERAESLEQAGDLEGAARAYRAYLSEFGPDPVARFNLANALCDSGKTEAAVERYRQALEIDPQYAAAWNNLGIALATLGEPDDAIDAWRRALDIDSHLADAAFNLADAFQQSKRFGEAHQMWKAYLEHDRDSEWAEYARACLDAAVA